MIRLPDLKEAGEIRSPRFGGLPPTYIPMRNAVFYSTAASFAEEVGAQIIIGGHNRGDRRTFADAGPRFFRDMQRALRSGAGVRTGGRVRILLPVAGLTKIEVIKLAKRRGVPLDLTWSCHRDREAHCWECEGCLSRVRTFEKAGVSDPLAPG